MKRRRSKPKPKADFRRGTVAARVGRAVSTRWRTLDQITRRARLPREVVLRKLHYGRRRGVYEYESEIRFKLKSKKTQ